MIIDKRASASRLGRCPQQSEATPRTSCPLTAGLYDLFGGSASTRLTQPTGGLQIRAQCVFNPKGSRKRSKAPSSGVILLLRKYPSVSSLSLDIQSWHRPNQFLSRSRCPSCSFGSWKHPKVHLGIVKPTHQRYQGTARAEKSVWCAWLKT